MLRSLGVTAAVLLLGNVAFGDEAGWAKPGPSSRNVVQATASSPMPATPYASKSIPCANGDCQPGPLALGQRYKLFQKHDGTKAKSHDCGEDGCDNPLGCGSFHSDFRFIFGSCRSFFGTSNAGWSHHHSDR